MKGFPRAVHPSVSKSEEPQCFSSGSSLIKIEKTVGRRRWTLVERSLPPSIWDVSFQRTRTIQVRGLSLPVSKSFGRAGERSGLETSIRKMISLCVDFKAKGSEIIR